MRSNAIAGLIQQIEISTGSSGRRGLQFLHEINSFPSFYVHPKGESRVHRGAGMKLCIISLDIRGYCFTDTPIELYARQIETAVQTFATTKLIDEARVLSVRTDEGLFAPYSIVDIEAQLLYRKE